MLKAIYAVLASAFVAGSFVAALSISAEVEARGSRPGDKGDRLDARPLAVGCSPHAWPYFESGCLRDPRNPFGRAEGVRLVSLDNLDSAKGKDARRDPHGGVASERSAPKKAREAIRVAADRRTDAPAKARPVH
jgi:hypothetical protein